MPDFAFCSGDLINAFVWLVSVSDDEVLVTVNHDAGNDEPARLDIQRVRGECKWFPIATHGRTAIAMVGQTVMVKLQRAA